MDAGVGHPVGVSGREGMLVILPLRTSSASRMGVKRVFSGLGPAPDIPGTTESIVLARTAAKRGCLGESEKVSETNGMDGLSLFYFLRNSMNMTAGDGGQPSYQEKDISLLLTGHAPYAYPNGRVFFHVGVMRGYRNGAQDV